MGGGGVRDFCCSYCILTKFSLCSHQVPIEFPICFKVPNVFLHMFSNSSSALSSTLL